MRGKTSKRVEEGNKRDDWGVGSEGWLRGKMRDDKDDCGGN